MLNFGMIEQSNKDHQKSVGNRKRNKREHSQ